MFHDPLVLPSLKRFHGNVMDLNIIIPQRPVTSVTVQESVATIGLALFVLRPLRDSNGPIEHLSLSLMDHILPSTLELIQSHTPRVSSLELSAPRPNDPTEKSIPEIEWASALATMKHLEHFTFETSLSRDGRPNPIPRFQKEAIVSAWFEASTSLQTVDFACEVVCDESSQMQSVVQEVDRWTRGAGTASKQSSATRYLVDNTWQTVV